MCFNLVFSIVELVRICIGIFYYLFLEIVENRSYNNKRFVFSIIGICICRILLDIFIKGDYLMLIVDIVKVIYIGICIL